MNPVAWIQGLEGLSLVAIICAFLFVEEVGVPLPFAPGDLLLAIAGIAIAAGARQPVDDGRARRGRDPGRRRPRPRGVRTPRLAASDGRGAAAARARPTPARRRAG